MARALIPTADILAADAAELALAVTCALLGAAILARAGRRVLLAGAIICCILLLPLAHLVISRSPRAVGAAALAVLLLPLFAWAAARWPAGQWGTARRLGASPLLILRRLVLPTLLPFLLAALVAGGLLLAFRRPPPPVPVLLPYPSTETG